MIQPFVANASAVLCDPANPASMQFITSDNSDNYVAANITNTIEAAEVPVLPVQTWIQFSPKLQQLLGRHPKMLVNTIFGLALTCMKLFRVW